MPSAVPITDRSSASPAGLSFFFPTGRRPTRDDVTAAVATIDRMWISFDPADMPVGRSDGWSDRKDHRGAWLELMMSGMTFDLLGLAPLPGVAVPPARHRIGFRQTALIEQNEVVALVPGPHIADAANTLPVLRAMLDMGCLLARALGSVSAIGWRPASTLIDVDTFCIMVANWTKGGPFPAHGIVAFSLGEGNRLASEGLRFFIGRELRFDAALSGDAVGATRLGSRIVNALVARDRTSIPTIFETETGETFSLSCAPGGHHIEVAPTWVHDDHAARGS